MEKYLVLDTETANSLDDPIVYDIGFAVIDVSALEIVTSFVDMSPS